MASPLRCEKPLLAQVCASDPFGDARTQPNRLRVQRSSSVGLSFDFNNASAGSRSIGHYVIGLNGSVTMLGSTPMKGSSTSHWLDLG